MQNLSQHVPSQYLGSISCHCQVKAIASRCASDIIVACMSNGSLIEFSKKCVLKTCEIKNCIPESVEFFIRYKPFCVFYIVKSQADVYVVAREQHLKVSHVFNEVEKVVKDDFLNEGYPQIGLWYCNQQSSKQPHFITDLSAAEKGQTASSDEFSMLFSERLQETRMRCAQLKQNLEEKRKLRLNQTQILLKNKLEEELYEQLADDSEMVLVFGEKNTSRPMTPKSPTLRLELRKVWQKLHNDQWIIGVQVVNKGKIPVVNMKMLLKFKNGNTLSYKTYIFTNNTLNDVRNDPESFSSLTTQWKSSEALKINILTTAIAVFELPPYRTDRKLILNGVITYDMENEKPQQGYQLFVPDIELDIEDIVSGTFSVFRNIPTVSEEDLLCILVSSQCFQLKTSELVSEILKEKFGFLSLSDYGRYYNDGSRLQYFSNVFVESWHTFGDEYHLTVYSRDSAQVLSLVQYLYSVIPHGAYIIPLNEKKTPDLLKMYKALEAEINFTTEQLSEWEEKFDVVDGKIHIPRKEYFLFKTSAFNLEKVTDELNTIENNCTAILDCNDMNR